MAKNHEEYYAKEIENITKNTDRQIANLISKMEKDEAAYAVSEAAGVTDSPHATEEKCNDNEEAIEMLV